MKKTILAEDYVNNKMSSIVKESQIEGDDFSEGDVLKVRKYDSDKGKGLSYPDMTVKALEDGFVGGWDVWEVVDINGTGEYSIYGFSIESIGEEELDEAEKRPIFVSKDGKLKYSISKNVETQEWIAKAYVNGKYDEGKTVYETDKESAIGTATAEIKRYDEKPFPLNIDESFFAMAETYLAEGVQAEDPDELGTNKANWVVTILDGGKETKTEKVKGKSELEINAYVKDIIKGKKNLKATYKKDVMKETLGEDIISEAKVAEYKLLVKSVVKTNEDVKENIGLTFDSIYDFKKHCGDVYFFQDDSWSVMDNKILYQAIEDLEGNIISKDDEVIKTMGKTVILPDGFVASTYEFIVELVMPSKTDEETIREWTGIQE